MSRIFFRPMHALKCFWHLNLHRYLRRTLNMPFVVASLGAHSRTYRSRVRTVVPRWTSKTLRRPGYRVVSRFARHQATSVHGTRHTRATRGTVLRCAGRVVPVGAGQLRRHRLERTVEPRRAYLARRSATCGIRPVRTLVVLRGFRVRAGVPRRARRAVVREADGEGARAARNVAGGGGGAGRAWRAPGAAHCRISAVVALRARLLWHRRGRAVITGGAPAKVRVSNFETSPKDRGYEKTGCRREGI